MTTPPWMHTLHTRGLLPIAHTILDVLEPLGVLGAQAMYIVQPAAGIFGAGWRAAVGDVAHALETPTALAALRDQMDILTEEDDPRRTL